MAELLKTGGKAIGFGTWAWGNQLLWGYRPDCHDEILEATFKEAIRGGLRLIDTADSYGTGQMNGRSELLLGRFVEGLSVKQRQGLTIATKLAPYPWRIGRKGFSKAFEASRLRLKGYLHRVQLHWSTARYFPWQEGPLLDGLADLLMQGKVHELGVSNVGPERLRWMHTRLAERGLKLTSLQVQLSLLSTQPLEENKVASACRDLGIDLLAYSPLALGVLAIPPGELAPSATPLRRGIFQRLLPASNGLRQGLSELAANRGVTQAQVALNWCRAHGALPIPGLRNPGQALDASRALLWDMEAEEKQRLDHLAQECRAKMPVNPFQSS